ncbi:flagellin [Pseudoalteromonas arctica]|uniref:flagellin n=1 Tax=Pseudoalteromonas arctica TaxID=394751 RepID=UPI003D14934E
MTIGDNEITLDADTTATLATQLQDLGYDATMNGTTLELNASGVDGVSFSIGTAGSVQLNSRGDTTNTAVTTANTDLGYTSALEFSSKNSFSVTGGTESAAATVNGTAADKMVSTIDITSQAGSQSALSIIDSAIAEIDSQRADLGAVQNRFDHTISNLANISENVSASRSRIQDTDFATETAEMTKNQILQQAGTSILSQANQLPQTALSLLG